MERDHSDLPTGLLRPEGLHPLLLSLPPLLGPGGAPRHPSPDVHQPLLLHEPLLHLISLEVPFTQFSEFPIATLNIVDICKPT